MNITDVNDGESLRSGELLRTSHTSHWKEHLFFVHLYVYVGVCVGRGAWWGAG